MRRADNLFAFKCGMSRIARGLKLLEGLSRPVMGLFLSISQNIS